MIGGRSVIAKTEKPRALENIAGIIELSDGITVSLGTDNTGAAGAAGSKDV